VSIEEDDDPRDLVATACRVLAANGHGDYIWGHAALRDRDGRGVWMKGAGYGFEEITGSEVVLVGFDGSLLRGTARRHVEWPIHTEVIAARADVNATVHSHPPYALALGASREPLRPVSHAGTLFVPPDVPRFERTANLIVSRELGEQVCADLGGARAMLMVNHGIVTAGSDLREAVVRAILLENACHQQLLTAGRDGAPLWSSDAEALAKRETIWDHGAIVGLWEYLVRGLHR
jgi:ribulose-5-phosphate 4-epimerase/fuculose-1-phosphate aldolase